MQSPFFSVIIPTYNRKEFLKKAINSVLEQTEKDWELLIVDDGSSDGSQPLKEEIAKEEIAKEENSQRRNSQRRKSQRRNSQRRKSRTKLPQKKYSLVHKKTLWSE